jgi:hypothetical protein
MSRADTTGRRLIAAIATEALSMIRLMIISVTSFGTATRSAATPAIFQASCSSRGRFAFDGYTFTSCSFIGKTPSRPTARKDWAISIGVASCAG